MRHTYFEIHNFKGIEEIRLDLDFHPRGNIYTLVGLNESGKTTILEAVNFLGSRPERANVDIAEEGNLNVLKYKPERIDPLDLPGYSIRAPHDLIPISKRSNFNGTTQIKAGYRVDEDDRDELNEFLLRQQGLRLPRQITDFTITQSYRFRDSRIQDDQPVTLYSFETNAKIHSGEKRQALADIITKLLPSVLYFPNFLFEFPERIYLEDVAPDAEKHKFYRLVFQDVLDSIGDGMTLERHILDRARDGSRPEQKNLKAVLQKMGSNIGHTVFGHWDSIFERGAGKPGKKEIIVECDRDDAGWFLQLQLKEHDDIYSISERSLGFRWFFAFLLLTQYRGFRKGAPRNVLFLFDEPASNLHSSAQSQLLKSFKNFRTFPKSCSIIYTTHSHHMINPDWLEGAYVVRNEALDYAAGQDANVRKTVITLAKYRDFAVRHPDQTTYFQPVLDVLEYSPSRLENIPDVVMVEGKNDFYTLKYLQETVLKRPKPLHLMRGTGSGNLANAIRLYAAWGREFIVLLDSDEPGEEQRSRYEHLFGALVKGRIHCLGDIEPTWKGKAMEDLIEEDDRRLIQTAAYPNAPAYKKKHFNRAVQELFLSGKVPSLSSGTLRNAKRILDFCAEQFERPNRLKQEVSRDSSVILEK